MNSTATTIGILGDGQLAMMLAESAHRRKIDFIGYGKDPESSFAKRFPKNFQNEIKHPCKSFTLENEFFTADQLTHIEQSWNTHVIPRPEHYRNFQNKVSQRTWYDSLSLPSPKWRAIPSSPPATWMDKVESDFHYPFVVKASAGGYDGYGVKVVSTQTEFEDALKKFGHSNGQAVLIEEMIAIKKEFAQGILLDGLGGRIYLPFVESIQKNGVCVLTLSRPTLPADELVEVQKKAREFLDKIADSGIVGLFHFEFFYTADGTLLINEGAPRPHNSSHLTIDASTWSQFDLLIEFLRHGVLPLKSGTQITAAPSVMVNLLGQSQGTDYELKLPQIPDGIEVYPKLYLKKENRPGRKMGHLNLVDRRSDPISPEAMQTLGEKILKEYRL